MKADTLVRHEGMNTLIKNLGLIEAERFIMLVQKETFDYTKWQENLFEDMTIEEIYNNAAKLRNENISIFLADQTKE
ncbi:MAG: hypothetical protein LBK56_08330 [Gracilibacteraceae bacterium]|jgi:hypothetical protein|nr:hypothetical protein [Gracilibacteraceae bacterium]